MTEELTQDQKVMRYSSLDANARKKIWVQISDISEEELDEHLAWQRARQANVLQVGAVAPDFKLDVLDRKRFRTGETVRLSELHGKPVALIFGSYT